jgi:hypothetical protein
MKYLPIVTRASYFDKYVITLRFSDGTSKSVDCSVWMKGPVFEPLKKKAYFRKFFIDGGAVTWPNGADLAPETLYLATDVSTDNKRLQRTREATNGKNKRRGTRR